MKAFVLLTSAFCVTQYVIAFSYILPTYLTSPRYPPNGPHNDGKPVAQFKSSNPDVVSQRNFPSILTLFPRTPQNDDGPQSAAAEAALEHHTGGFRNIPTTPASRSIFRTAHGVLMATTFTILLPLGAIVMNTTHRTYLHAGIQSFAYLCAIAGMGLGIWLGRNVRYLDYAHTVIGMCVLGALLFQVALGVGTHLAYVRKEKEKGGPVGYTGWIWLKFVHRWAGRGLMVLGIVNGGLGLKLAQNTTGGIIAYAIVAGLMGLVYVMAVVLGMWKGHRMMKVENEEVEMEQRDL